MRKWKKLRAVYSCQTPWVSIRKDTYQLLPEKEFYDYFVVERADFVVIVPETRDGKFVLVRQYRHGAEKTILNFPMGFLGRRENPLFAAKRELLEETGFGGGTMKFLGSFFLCPGLMKTRQFTFSARGLVKPKNTKTPEKVEEIVEAVELVTKKQLENLIRKNKLEDLISVGAYALVKEKEGRD